MSPTVSAECREVLELIDAGTGALGRADRPTAAGHFARASESLFRQAATCRDAERKVRLARQAQELLATVRTLRGLPAAGSDDTAEPSDGGSSNATGDPETNPVAVRLKTDIRFDDVAGLDDVKEVLHLRLVYPLKHPEKLARYGLRSGGGLLLFGPPGTGKTMIASAVAGELELPFYPVKPSAVLSKWFGESAQRLAALFDEARRSADGAVIFVDEIDSLGGSRDDAGSSEASRRLLTQLLQELDGVQGRDEGLLFLAATNEPWLLDDALLRPGRFDEKCYVPLPDEEARRVLMRLHLRKAWVADEIDPDAIAARTAGYSGADLMCLCERAKQIPYRESVLDGTDRPLAMAGLETALATLRPSVTAEQVRRFEEYANR